MGASDPVALWVRVSLPWPVLKCSVSPLSWGPSLQVGWTGIFVVWLTEPFLAGGVAEFVLDLLLVILGVWECDWEVLLVDCWLVACGLLTCCWWIADLHWGESQTIARKKFSELHASSDGVGDFARGLLGDNFIMRLI